MLPDRLPDLARAIPSAAIATFLILGGCTAAPAGSPSPATSATPSATVASSTVSPSATPPAPSPSTAPSPSPVASPSQTPLPTVAAAPSGPWSSLAWIDAGAVPLGPNNVGVTGWNGGYVALDQNGGDDGEGNVLPTVIRASASSDGLRWSAAATLDTSGLSGNVEIGRIVEGPSGLLAIGYPFGDTCGGPPVVVALWSSADGRAWHRLSLPKDFRTGQVETISGGSAGFIAAGHRADGTTQALWTSPDGRTWTSRPLPKVTSGVLVLDGAVSFRGGFVVAGAVLGEGGCGGPAHIHAATWWSADGTAWTRATLPGAMTAASATRSVSRLSDRVVIVSQRSGDGETLLAWTSTDGRAWTAVPHPSEQLTLDPVGDGRHAALMLDPDSGSGAPTVRAVGEDGRATTLAQTGPGPVASEEGPGWTFAVGPTGILVVQYDGRAAWLGVPS